MSPQAQEGVPVAFENIVNYVRMLTIFGMAKVKSASARLTTLLGN